MRFPHYKLLFASITWASTLLAASPSNEEVFAPPSIEHLFESYCYNCHDADTAKADLNLEGLTRSIDDSADALNWQDVLDQLNSGEMPPKDKKQSSDQELAMVFGDLTETLQAAQKVQDTGAPVERFADANATAGSIWKRS